MRLGDRSSKPHIAVVTPALGDANNGNAHTALRWARALSDVAQVRLLTQWDANGPLAGDLDLLLALHARRSSSSIHAFARAHPKRPLIVTLTGTDLYQDVPAGDAAALRSLDEATRLVVLQEAAIDAVPPQHRHKVDLCFQSIKLRRVAQAGRRAADPGRLRAVAVGHLRAVKDPLTVMRAMELLRGRLDLRLDHWGEALEPVWKDAATRAMASAPGYRWHGAASHARVLKAMQGADVLVHASVLEGGAHVVLEAVRLGLPVLASRMPGNVGMLGAQYEGYFEVGDAAGLAQRLARLQDEPGWGRRLQRQCQARAPLFSPAREQQRLRQIVGQALSLRAEGVASEPVANAKA